MSPTLFMFVGCAGGLGIFLVVLGMRKRPDRRRELAEAANQLGRSGNISSSALQVQAAHAARAATSRVEEQLRSKLSLRQDAVMVGRSLESHALYKLTGLVLGSLGFVCLGLFADLLGLFNLPLPAILIGGVLGGFGGWWLPDSILSTDADKEREVFRQAAESWMELVAQLVTAGSDTFAALHTASTYSQQPVFVAISESMRRASAGGKPPWDGLRRLADERRLRFLDPLCAALELAGTTGAGSREAILSQVEAARSKAMHAADAEAASAGEKMGAPLALIGGAFMILMGYPPLAGVMDSTSLTGPGL